MADLNSTIARLYSAAFNRTPDAAGIQYWVDQVNSGIPLSFIDGFFASSQEFVASYGALDTDGFVQQLYQNVLTRAGDAQGVQYWNNAITNGASRGDILNAFAQSAENIVLTDARNAPAPPVAAPAVVPPVAEPPPAAPQPAPPAAPAATPPPPAPAVVASIPPSSLDVISFIHADSTSNLSSLTIEASGTLVTGSISDVGTITISGGTLEIQNGGLGNAVVNVTTPPGQTDHVATLILDHPPVGELTNTLLFGGGFGGRIELGGLQFNGSQFIPNQASPPAAPHTASSGQAILEQNGAAVYTLNIGSFSAYFGSNAVGVDAQTGFAFKSFG